MSLTVDPRKYEGRRNLCLISFTLILLTFIQFPTSAATVSTPVIKPMDDPRVYIPEYCQLTGDPVVCDGDHFRVVEQPVKKKVEKIKPRNVPGKKLPKYRHGHRR